MKKIILIIASIFIMLSSICNVNADKLEKKLYKSVIISKKNIETKYPNGKEINKKIYTIFAKYRYEKDTQSLIKLEKILKPKIVELNIKKILSRKERLNINLYNNLYYRIQLLLKYQLN